MFNRREQPVVERRSKPRIGFDQLASFINQCGVLRQLFQVEFWISLCQYLTGGFICLRVQSSHVPRVLNDSLVFVIGNGELRTSLVGLLGIHVFRVGDGDVLIRVSDNLLLWLIRTLAECSSHRTALDSTSSQTTQCTVQCIIGCANTGIGTLHGDVLSHGCAVFLWEFLKHTFTHSALGKAGSEAFAYTIGDDLGQGTIA